MKPIIKDSKEYLFRKYNIEYDDKHKILYIRKPILVKHFIVVKEIAKEMSALDIRVI